MKKRLFFSLIVISSFCFFCQSQTITPFKKGDRVVFVGNSITDGGLYHSYIWLYYMTRFPEVNITVINAGIGGDTAAEIYKRIDGDVLDKKPTYLITTFGMNDSGYFEYNGEGAEEFADRKVQASYDAYKMIEERYKKLPGVHQVIMGSSPYDETAIIEGNTPFKNKNKAMLRIVDFQEKSAKANGWEFIDLNKPMTAINERIQVTDPTFTLCGSDRIHPDNIGHMVMAYLFLKGQGFAGKEVVSTDIDASKAQVISTSNCTVTGLKKEADGISFDYLANALPYPLDTIARGWGMHRSQSEVTQAVPFTEEMNQEILKVTGLKGNYKLLIDNEEIGTWSGEEYAKGINLATLSNTPQYQQALKIMHLNAERWEIERRFRDYAWVQFNFFQGKDLLFANNREAINVMDQFVQEDGWLRAKRDLYSKAMFPEVREAWQKEMDLLVSIIYDINKPVTRKISLIRK